MKQTILNTISDLCGDFLFHDRKESEDLTQEQLDEAIESGEITIDEMVAEFRKHLEATYPETASQQDSLVFGRYCTIEQKRHGVPNEQYVHKIIGTLQSNEWVEVPVQLPKKETLHDEMADVLLCITVGVDETEVMRYRKVDCKPKE